MVALESLRQARGFVPRAPALAMLLVAAGCTPQNMLRGRAAAVPLPAPSMQVYTLQPGETLWRVARRHGMTADELARKNGIADPTKVRAGTVLKVPTATPAGVTAAPVAGPVEAPGAGRSPELTAALARAGSTRSPTARKEPPAEGLAPAAPPPAAGSGGTPPTPAEASPGSLGTPPRSVEASPKAPADPHALATPEPPPAGGDDDKPAPASYPLRWPFEGRVVARFGARDGAAHDGIDIGGDAGTPVRAAAPGKVIFAGRQGSYGNLVIVRHEGGLLTVYAHLSVTLVRRGQAVVGGDAVGRLGGTSTAPAPLHFEVREGVVARNPLKFLPP